MLGITYKDWKTNKIGEGANKNLENLENSPNNKWQWAGVDMRDVIDTSSKKSVCN